MAIAFGSTGTRLLIGTAASTWNVAYPSGIAAGDLLVLHIITNGGAVTSSSLTGAGWTVVYNEATVSNPKGGLYYKIASGSESGTLAVTVGSTTGNAVMYRYTGVDPTTPLNGTATSVSDNTAASTTSVIPSITTTVANTYLVYANGINSGSATVSGPGTERVDHAAVGGTGSKGGALYDEPIASAGATNTRTINWSGARNQWGAMMALNPYNPPVPTVYLETFDNNDDGIWAPTIAGAGTTSVSTSDDYNSVYGISANVPAATVDKAGFTTTFTGVQEATIEGWWKVTTEGASSGSNVPFARIFSGSQRLADVYRQNQQGAGANVWMRVVKAIGGSNYYFIPTGYNLPLNTWVYMKFGWGLDGKPFLSIDGTVYLDDSDAPADWFAASSIDTAYLGTHEAGNQGAWSMDTVTLTTYPANVTPVLAKASYGLFSGSGTLTASATPNAIITKALSGSGTLTSTRTMTALASGSLSGSGTLTGSLGSLTITKSVPLSGTGTLSKAVVAGFTAGMSSSSTGTLTTATNGMSAQAVFPGAGSGTLTGSCMVHAITKSVAFSGSGTLTSTRTLGVTITKALSGVGDLTATTSNSYTASGSLSGSGTLSGAITGMSLTRSAALSGSGTLTGATVNNKAVSVNLSGSGAFAPFLTAVGFTQAAGLSGSGTLSGTSTVQRAASPQLSGLGTLTRTVVPDIHGVFTGASEGVLSGTVSTMSMVVTAQLAGVGNLTGDPDELLNYDVTAYLAEKRWSGGLGSQRWKGSL